MVSGQLQKVRDFNIWDSAYVSLAERKWGRTMPKYTKDIFNFAFESGDSWIDLGCGFGRFLRFLVKKVKDPDYIGYDSSSDMIKRITELYPEFHLRIFHRDITRHVPPTKAVVISNAVFIHLKSIEQQKILTNISKMRPLPRAIVFDINSYTNMEGSRPYFVEETSERNFRMSYQDPKSIERRLKKLFKQFSLKTKTYSMPKGVYKTAFFLKRPGLGRFVQDNG